MEAHKDPGLQFDDNEACVFNDVSNPPTPEAGAIPLKDLWGKKQIIIEEKLKAIEQEQKKELIAAPAADECIPEAPPLFEITIPDLAPLYEITPNPSPVAIRNSEKIEEEKKIDIAITIHEPITEEKSHVNQPEIRAQGRCEPVVTCVPSSLSPKPQPKKTSVCDRLLQLLACCCCWPAENNNNLRKNA